MAKTSSSMVPLQTKAPMFVLPDVISEKNFNLADNSGKHATVIMFICNHCPYVKYIEEKLLAVARQYQHQGITFIAINSNDVEHYPDDSPLAMRETATAMNYPFVYLFDESQEVARAYNAACTPDFFVFDKDLALVYRGQFDDARPGNNITVSGASLTAALDAILAGKPVHAKQLPSLGCNIKWLPA
jgi:thiol-disulfide isomerase/thioredoxin